MKRRPTIGARLAAARTRTAAARSWIEPAPALRWDGHRLRDARRARSMTQRRVADLVETFQSHVSRWENGQSPTATNLLRLAQALAVDARELLP